MSKPVLTAKAVTAAKPEPGRRREIPDGIVPGLYLIVQPSGRKSFALRTRVATKNGARPVKLTLGRFTTKFGLAEARQAARAKLEAVHAGGDPRPRRVGQLTVPQVSLPETFGELCDTYITDHLKKSVKRWKAAQAEIENHVRPRIGEFRIEEVSRGHVREVLKAVEAERGPVAANRTLARIRAVFRWAIGEDLCNADPTMGIKRPARELPRDRSLTDVELAAVWNAAGELGYPAGPYFRFLVLCGCRRDEVRLAHWSEIDLKRRNWEIPAARMKAGKPHLVPLTETMIELLSDMPFRGKGGFVFWAKDSETPYGNVQKPKSRIVELSEVSGWSPHDLRRTLRTGLSRLGVRADVAERILAHEVGGSLLQTYDKYEYRSEKLAALEAWDAHVSQIAAGAAMQANAVQHREAV